MYPSISAPKIITADLEVPGIRDVACNKPIINISKLFILLILLESFLKNSTIINKIATNTNMYNKLSEDMDINAGTIMDNVASVNEVGKEIFDKIISVASGEKSKSEINDYGDDEFNPWIIGATL